jgi:hypothetical protein
MVEEDIDGDFTVCSVVVLNRFFAAYRNSHSQGTDRLPVVSRGKC